MLHCHAPGTLPRLGCFAFGLHKGLAATLLRLGCSAFFHMVAALGRLGCFALGLRTCFNGSLASQSDFWTEGSTQNHEEQLAGHAPGEPLLRTLDLGP